MPPVQPSRQSQNHRPPHGQFTARAQVDQTAGQSSRDRFRGCRRCRRTGGGTGPGPSRGYRERGSVGRSEVCAVPIGEQFARQ